MMWHLREFINRLYDYLTPRSIHQKRLNNEINNDTDHFFEDPVETIQLEPNEVKIQLESP